MRQLTRGRVRAALASPVVRSVLTRALGIPVAGVASLTTSALIVRDLGFPVYGALALITSLTVLVPVNDFGLGAAIVLAANHGQHDPARRRGWDVVADATAHGLRRTTQIAAAVSSVSLVLFMTGALGTLTDHVPVRGFALALLLAVVGWSLTIPTSLGFRLLIAYDQTFLAQALQPLTSVLTLAAIGALLAVGAPLPAVAVAPFAAQGLAGVIGLVLGHRYGAPPVWPLVVRAAAGRYRRPPRTGYAASTAVVSNAAPLAYQSDRYLIQVGLGTAAVSSYSAVAQVYAPLYSLLVSGGQALWPMFLRLQAQEAADRRRAFRRAMGPFLGLGLVLALASALLGPVVASVISDGQATDRLSLGLAFGALLLAQSVWTPLANALSDPAGFRVQARLSVLLVPANVGLSLLLLRVLGPTGPIWASTATTVVVLVIPLSIRLRRTHRAELPSALPQLTPTPG